MKVHAAPFLQFPLTQYIQSFPRELAAEVEAADNAEELAAEAAETHCSSQMRAIGMYVGSATKTLWFVGKKVSFGKPLQCIAFDNASRNGHFWYHGS